MTGAGRYLRPPSLSLRHNPIWLLRMAWRDSRSHRGRLLLFVSSISLGIGALVAVSTLSAAMKHAVDDQANTLLGADLVVTSNRPFVPAAGELFAELGGEQATQVRFSSMIYFAADEGGRLVQVRSVEGRYPFYGRIETEPAAAAEAFREGANALVDDTLMLQFDAAVGDSISVGDRRFSITGRLLKIPGEAPMATDLEPRVFIPTRYLEETRLLQQGSRVSHRRFFRFADGTDVEAIVAAVQPRLEELQLRFETVASRKRNLGRPLIHLYRFLNLGSFVALLLGSVGVASSIHTYVRGKLNAIAVLRCLGANPVQTLGIYLIQALAMGLVGSLAGIVAGTGVILLLPHVVGDFLPLDIPLDAGTLSTRAILRGLAVGVGISTGFALLPLLGIRLVSPLLALRATIEQERNVHRDPLRYILFAFIAAGIVAFAISQTRQWMHGLGFAVGLFVAFAVLTLVATLITYGVRRVFPHSWSYIWRQGLANLHRPNNQTTMLVLGLGLGTFLIATLYMLQSALLRDITAVSNQDQPNAVLIDIQTDQADGVAALVQRHGAELLDRVPIVSMRLSTVNGVAVEELRKRPGRGSRWALNRDYRVTYRDHLTDTEQLVAGRWHSTATGDSIYISLETGVARSLQVGLGDEIVFDVQGLPVTTVVGSLREVNWRRLRTNFLVVFPAGVLEAAPQFQVFLTRVDPGLANREEISAAMQRDLAVGFPNVSTVDLELILSTVNAILEKVTLVIRFLALFSVATGLLVLLGVVTSSRYQRMLESVLLRTLGATRRQVEKIMVLEYVFLGSLAAVNGLLLALAATWGLARFVFEISFEPDWLPVAMVISLVIALTVVVGLLSSRGVHDRSPLEVLRGTA